MTEHMRIGIVDMGSNAVRFMIAEVSGSEQRAIESHRLPVRLGQEVFKAGVIPESAIADTVDAFRRFRASCDRLGVQRTRAIATSAMREARNRSELVHRVREAAQFDIDVISGAEEAYLLKLGVQTKVNLSKGRSLLVDVGGGSVELVVTDDGDVESANSYRLGALRLKEMFRDAGPKQFFELVQRHLKGLGHRLAEHLDGASISRYAAVGGNIDSLADLVVERVPVGTKQGVEAVRVKDLADELRALAKMTTQERIDELGLRPDRADTIVPAGCVYLHLARLAGVDHVMVPRCGIKEGLLVEAIHVNRASFVAEDHVDVVLSSCRAMGKRFGYEAEHAESVLHLAQRLFDQTATLHELDDHARVLLQAAALLHDVGVAVNNDGHHKHSQYLIESTDLVGLGRSERHIVALVARYHRKAMPRPEHTGYSALRRRDREMVERLAAVLRLADALDRQHAAVVTDVAVTIGDKTLELTPTLRAGESTKLTLEAKAIERKGELFEHVFGLKPVLSSGAIVRATDA